MKIRATRTFLNDVGTVRRGAEIDIRDVDARQLIKKGIAVAVEDETTQPSRKVGRGKGAAAPKEGD